MKKLFVAGCSFSDYTNVEQTYGEILASKLEMKYVHEGAGCGSNYRIWRKITDYVLDGNLTSDDLLIVQYTDTTRQEFWSPYKNYYFKPSIHGIPIADKFHNNGGILRYKFNSWVWQNNEEEKVFFKMYEENFLNPKFEDEKFRVYNYNFQQMLKNNQIKTIFLTTFRLPSHGDYVISYFKPYEFMDQSNELSSSFNLTPEDGTHMNQLGHENLADRLYNHVRQLNLLGN